MNEEQHEWMLQRMKRCEQRITDLETEHKRTRKSVTSGLTILVIIIVSLVIPIASSLFR
jgi:hypothetical protein